MTRPQDNCHVLDTEYFELAYNILYMDAYLTVCELNDVAPHFSIWLTHMESFHHVYTLITFIDEFLLSALPHRDPMHVNASQHISPNTFVDIIRITNLCIHWRDHYIYRPT